MVKGLSGRGKLLGKGDIGWCVIAITNSSQVNVSARSYQTAYLVIQVKVVGNLVLWAGIGRHCQPSYHMPTKL